MCVCLVCAFPSGEVSISLPGVCIYRLLPARCVESSRLGSPNIGIVIKVAITLEYYPGVSMCVSMSVFRLSQPFLIIIMSTIH